MNKSTRATLLFFFIVLLVMSIPKTAFAYGGPGSIISGIGAFLAAVGAVLAAIFGFLWFPIKRLFTSSDDDEKKVEEESNE